MTGIVSISLAQSRNKQQTVFLTLGQVNTTKQPHPSPPPPKAGRTTPINTSPAVKPTASSPVKVRPVDQIGTQQKGMYERFKFNSAVVRAVSEPSLAENMRSSRHRHSEPPFAVRSGPFGFCVTSGPCSPAQRSGSDPLPTA